MKARTIIAALALLVLGALPAALSAQTDAMSITGVKPTDTTVTITGTASQSGAVVYGSSATNLTLGSAPFTIAEGSTSVPFTTTITGLSPSTTYYFRLKRTNGSFATNVLSWKTTAPVAIESVFVSTLQASPNADHVSADIYAIMNGLAANTSYNFTVKYGTAADALTQSTFTYLAPGISGMTAKLTGLSGGTKYFYQVFDTSTNTVLSSVQSFKTGGTPSSTGASGGAASSPAPQPGQVPVAETNNLTATSTGAVIGGRLTASANLAGLAIIYGTNKDAFDNSQVGYFTQGYFGAMLSDLTPNTTYYYRVVGTIDYNGSTDTATINQGGSFKTAAAGAQPLATIKPAQNTVTLTVDAVSQTSVKITGVVPTLTTRVEVLVDTTGTGSFNYHAKPTVASDRTFAFTLTGLAPSHVYSVMAVNPDSPSVILAGVQTFATPGANIAVSLTPLDLTSARISVTTSGGVQDMLLKFGTDPANLTGEVPFVLASDGTYSATMSGLDSTASYAYQIYGTSGSVAVPYSDVFNFMPGGTSGGATAARPSGSSGGTSGSGSDATGAGSTNGSSSGTTSGSLPPPPSGAKSALPATGAKSSTSSSDEGLSFTGGLVKCGQNGPLIDKGSGDDGSGGTYNPNGVQACGFKEFMQFLSRGLDFLIFLVAPIIMTLTLLWAGLQILTAGGSGEKVGEAKKMIFKAIIGMVIAMAAWISIKFILVQLEVERTVFPVFFD